ncbi:hypothetical protein BB560_004401 [Smittium megazygosporum]|uniref:Cytochrome P450 n=1 Tax=Smittium megazygosporum TaxID=133381 RepID=A0A2T9Z9B9_9FUNG|nr:hypothetical protein BB560_004401 [Smittium megazygosporum]
MFLRINSDFVFDNVQIRTIENFELNKNGNIINYLKKFKEANYIAHVESSKTDFVLGDIFQKEYFHYPMELFSRTKSHKKVLFRSSSSYQLFRNKSFNILFSQILSGKHKNLIFSKIPKSINQAFIKAGEDHLQDQRAIKLIYGKKIADESLLYKSIRESIFPKFTYMEVNLAKIFDLSFLKKESDLFEGYGSVRRVLNSYFGHLGTPESKTTNDGIVDILDSLKYKMDISHDEFHSDLYYWIINFNSVVSICLSNFIVEIAVNPHTFSPLALEQKNIIFNYGEKISKVSLRKMILLDAAIAESMRMSNVPFSFSTSCKDIFFSNGALVPKDSQTKFNVFLYNRNSKIFGKNAHLFSPDRQLKLKNKLNIPSPTNFTWGAQMYVCPFKDFISDYMKIFAATFIRTFRICKNHEGEILDHGGYVFEDLITRANKSVYLRKHNISYYVPDNF